MATENLKPWVDLATELQIHGSELLVTAGMMMSDQAHGDAFNIATLDKAKAAVEGVSKAIASYERKTLSSPGSA